MELFKPDILLEPPEIIVEPFVTGTFSFASESGCATKIVAGREC